MRLKENIEPINVDAVVREEGVMDAETVFTE
jgi:hypothetical protein